MQEKQQRGSCLYHTLHRQMGGAPHHPSCPVLQLEIDFEFRVCLQRKLRTPYTNRNEF